MWSCVAYMHSFVKLPCGLVLWVPNVLLLVLTWHLSILWSPVGEEKYFCERQDTGRRDENASGQSEGYSQVRWREFCSNTSIFSVEHKAISWLIVKSWESKLKRGHNILEQLPQGRGRGPTRGKASNNEHSSSPQIHVACASLQCDQDVISEWMMVKPPPLSSQCLNMPRYEFGELQELHLIIYMTLLN